MGGVVVEIIVHVPGSAGWGGAPSPEPGGSSWQSGKGAGNRQALSPAMGFSLSGPPPSLLYRGVRWLRESESSDK